jgi:predicted TIM-barrel fold metal-dependent hydrolase
MVERIDAFAHALPERFLEEMADIHPTAELMDMSDSTHMWDVDHRLSDMDEYGVDKQCIMLSRSTIWRGLDPDDALPLAELANDTMVELADESDRLIPVGTIPMATDDFVSEFRRCIEDLGMAGVQIFSNVDGRPIDGEEFHELYAVAEELDAPLWLHPQLAEYYDWTDEYGNDKIFGWLFDTSLALARLVFSGVMQEYPDLQVIPHHVGAMVPFFNKRIETFVQAYSHLDYADLDEPVLEYFRRFYPDTCANGSVSALECGLDFFGTDQMVFGTDYPFGPEKGTVWMRNTVESVDALDVSDEDRAKIYHENIESMMA